MKDNKQPQEIILSKSSDLFQKKSFIQVNNNDINSENKSLLFKIDKLENINIQNNQTLKGIQKFKLDKNLKNNTINNTNYNYINNISVNFFPIYPQNLSKNYKKEGIKNNIYEINKKCESTQNYLNKTVTLPNTSRDNKIIFLREKKSHSKLMLRKLFNKEEKNYKNNYKKIIKTSNSYIFGLQNQLFNKIKIRNIEPKALRKNKNKKNINKYGETLLENELNLPNKNLKDIKLVNGPNNYNFKNSIHNLKRHNYSICLTKDIKKFDTNIFNKNNTIFINIIPNSQLQEENNEKTDFDSKKIVNSSANKILISRYNNLIYNDNKSKKNIQKIIKNNKKIPNNYNNYINGKSLNNILHINNKNANNISYKTINNCSYRKIDEILTPKDNKSTKYNNSSNNENYNTYKPNNSNSKMKKNNHYSNSGIILINNDSIIDNQNKYKNINIKNLNKIQNNSNEKKKNNIIITNRNINKKITNINQNQKNKSNNDFNGKKILIKINNKIKKKKKLEDIIKNINEINNSINTINNKNKSLYNNTNIIFISSNKKNKKHKNINSSDVNNKNFNENYNNNIIFISNKDNIKSYSTEKTLMYNKYKINKIDESIINTNRSSNSILSHNNLNIQNKNISVKTINNSSNRKNCLNINNNISYNNNKNKKNLNNIKINLLTNENNNFDIAKSYSFYKIKELNKNIKKLNIINNKNTNNNNKYANINKNIAYFIKKNNVKKAINNSINNIKTEDNPIFNFNLNNEQKYKNVNYTINKIKNINNKKNISIDNIFISNKNNKNFNEEQNLTSINNKIDFFNNNSNYINNIINTNTSSNENKIFKNINTISFNKNSSKSIHHIESNKKNNITINRNDNKSENKNNNILKNETSANIIQNKIINNKILSPINNFIKSNKDPSKEEKKISSHRTRGNSTLIDIPRKECNICHKLIETHLLKIHFNSHPSQIFNWMFLGTYMNACDINELRRININCILNCAAECPNYHLPEDINELHLNIRDDKDFYLFPFFEEANIFINKARFSGKIILIHCKFGISRSVSFIIAYLIKYYGFNVKNALNYIKRRRYQINPNKGFLDQLIDYEKYIKERKK